MRRVYCKLGLVGPRTRVLDPLTKSIDQGERRLSVNSVEHRPVRVRAPGRRRLLALAERLGPSGLSVLAERPERYRRKQ